MQCWRCARGALVAVVVFVAACGAAPQASAATPVADPWSVISTPNVGSAYNALNDVTCHRLITSCWAVGDYQDAKLKNEEGLIEHWNGTRWSIVGSPAVSAEDSVELVGVACGNFYSCWAVGEREQSDDDSVFMEHWDGSSWAQFLIPAGTSGVPEHITCASLTECWAVGYQVTPVGRSERIDPLVLRWNGQTWTNSPFPIPSSDENEVQVRGISCMTDDECWAVATTDTFASTGATLIEKWNGQTWTPVTSPDRADWAQSNLTSVTCVTAADCWAVGQSENPSRNEAIDTSLIEHWNGLSWTRYGAPSSGRGEDFLNSVDCTSASLCIATGYSEDRGEDSETLIETWNGTSWSLTQSAPPTATSQASLSAISCRSGRCFTAGSTGAGGQYGVQTPGATTLMEQFGSP